MNIEEPEVIPGCHSVATTCKACKRPITIKVANDCPQSWSGMLLPMATCDHCYDMWRDRQTIGGRIQAICVALLTLSQEKPSNKEREAILGAMNSALLAKLRDAYNEYIKAVAAWHNTQIVAGSLDSMLKEIMDDPDEFWPVLRRVRTYIAQRQTVQPFRLTPKGNRF